MTRIDFYLSKSRDKSDRLSLTCRLVERILAAEKRILIYCPDAALAQQLDRLLWTWRDGSFIPHGMLTAVDPMWTPVLITTIDDAAQERDVLINLALTVPECRDHFERLCEPLDQQPDILAAGRQRWQFYQTENYPLQHNDIST